MFLQKLLGTNIQVYDMHKPQHICTVFLYLFLKVTSANFFAILWRIMFNELLFFMWKKNFLFSRYLVPVFLVNPETSKSLTSPQTLQQISFYTFHFFLKTLAFIKFVRYQGNSWQIFLNFLLTLLWKLETSSRPFYDFDLMTM